MKRGSLTWWLVILPTSVTVGGTTFLLVGHLTDLGVTGCLAVAAIATFTADIAVATAVQALAPTKVNIGPGEKHLISDMPTEGATIVSGFDSSSHGRVAIRGETWRAIRSADDTGALSAGMAVSVVDRIGLTLVVSRKSG